MTLRLAAFLALFALPVWAVQPDEMLADPELEARAQALDAELRCVRCRSESVASSNAAWAQDARVMVRELVAAGATDDEVLDFFVDRYGEFVLMRPRAEGLTLILWIAGPLMLLGAGALVAAYLRSRSRAAPAAADALDPAEERRLRELLDG